MIRRGRLWGACGLGLVLLASLAPLAAQEASRRVVEVGRLPLGAAVRGSGDGALIMNPKARRGYQVFQTTDSRTLVQAFSLDTFRLLNRVLLPGIPILGGQAFPGEYIHAVDEETNRIFLPYGSGQPFTGVWVLDGTTLELKRNITRLGAFLPPVPQAPGVDPNLGGLPRGEGPRVTNVPEVCTAANCIPRPPGANPTLRGLAFVPAIRSPVVRDKLLLLLEDPTSAQSVDTLVQWDVETGRQDWTYQVTSCRGRLPVQNNQYSIGIFQSGRGPYIYLGCFASGGGAGGTGTGQVVQLIQDGGTSIPQAEVGYPGPLGLVDVLADPGADRLLLVVLNEEGQSYWVFDGPSAAYVGVIGTTLGNVSAASGIDPSTGRLYVLAPPSKRANQSDPGGLFLADARRSPAPQAIAFPEFASDSVYRIGVDPAADGRPPRVYVLPRGATAYRILEDRVPPSVDPPLADQDRFTTDAEEVEGVTGSNYTGTAHAYGLRSVFIGGLEGAMPVRGVLPIVGSPCSRSDREILLARIRGAQLSNTLASATTVAADAEATTRADAQEPTSRCLPRALPLTGLIPGFDRTVQETAGPALKAVDSAAGQSWPFLDSECAGDSEVSHAAVQLPGYTSTSRCRQRDAVVEASAVGQALNDPAGLTVGSAYASTRLQRVRGKGLVVHTEAWVRGVAVPGAFRIDLVRTVAEAVAGGRVGSARTSFERRICGVTIPKEAFATAPPDQRPSQDLVFEGCYDPFAQPPLGDVVGSQPDVNKRVTDRPLLYLLNVALGTRGRVRAPEPDPELAKGSPGGYLASVQKNRGEEIQARAISGDASTEVPALEILLFNDDPSFGRGRQLYQFAGVDASATYGIYVPPSIVFDDDDGLGDDSGGGQTFNEFLVGLTGGYPPADLGAPTRPREAQLPGNVIAHAPNRFVRGLKFLARSPREAALASAVWLLLAFPLYLSVRRRALVGARR